MEETILEINNLRKVYSKLVAVDNLSFEVKKGQVFGLLGPNGSGKTTTLGMLLGVLKPTSGEFSWFENGQEDANRLRIGALLETPNFYPYLNAVDNLTVIAKIKGMTDFAERIDEVLKKVRLYERRNARFRTFSLGMKQRLALAATMLSNPDVYVLDEPTNGLDPEGIAEIRNLVTEIAAEGKTIIIASHILDEVEKVCSHVAIMRKGKLLQIGSIDEITSQDRMVSVKSEDMESLAKQLASFADCHLIEHRDDEVIVSLKDKTSTAQLNKYLCEKGIYLSELREHRKNLESIFLEIVKS